MIKTFCDDCGRELRDKPDAVNKDNADWKPDARGQLMLTMEREGIGKSFLLNMDLCFKCTRKYFKALKEPI